MNSLKHLAIIMDGNGRWAKKRGFIRTYGHEIGANVVEDIASFCAKKQIKTLTLYAFSTENWKRPKKEIDFLMDLMIRFLQTKKDMFIQNSIKFHTIGNLEQLKTELKNEIIQLKNLTKNNDKLNLVLAINYGAKDEIVRAIDKLAKNALPITSESINSNLDTSEFGDVDLLIRTGGEKRLSNFLLWQLSYAELFFTDTLWPDFTSKELEKILSDFNSKHRRFGSL